MAPSRTPPAVIGKLNAALLGVLDDPETRLRLKQVGVTPSPSSPEQFGRYLGGEISRYGKLIRDNGIKGE